MNACPSALAWLLIGFSALAGAEQGEAPAPRAKWGFTGREADVYYRILPALALAMVSEKAMLERKAEENVRFVPLQIVNRSNDVLIWREGHDLALLTLASGEKVVSEAAGRFLGDRHYPWGFSHVADLVTERFTVGPGETRVKFLAFHAAFAYDDIVSAELQRGHRPIALKRITLKKTTARGVLPPHVWKRITVEDNRRR